MSSSGLVVDPCFEEHDTGPGHPERPERLRHVRRALSEAGLTAAFEPCPTLLAEDGWILGVHDEAHLEKVERTCRAAPSGLLDADTTVCRESARIARLAAGSLVALCGKVARGEWANGFAAVRPPGHHAERDRAMGFCLFNNVAVAANWLRARAGLSRVAIVDWDVHHGNGTQQIFEESADVFYASVHQSPLYPGTGEGGERGRGAGEGATLNCPLPPGSGDAEFLGALKERIAPALLDFDPDFLLISAGFDAHVDDPLANLEVTTPAYAEATRILLDVAERRCQGRLVSVLEGGYQLDALGASVVGHAQALLASNR